MQLQISGAAPAVALPLPVDDRTMRILNSSRPAPSVNKNFLTRTVAALETENKMAKVSQMWSERNADKKFEKLTEVPKHSRKDAHSMSMEAANERAYWAAQKAMAAAQEKTEIPAAVIPTVAAFPVCETSTPPTTRPHRRSRSRHRHRSKESSRKKPHRHHHRKHRRRDRSSSVSSEASEPGKRRERRRSPSGSRSPS